MIARCPAPPMNRRLFLSMAAAGLAAGCAQPDPTVRFADLTFTGRQPIRLDVAGLEVVDEYRMPLADPNVEHRAPLAPSAAAERWARDVLRPAGRGGRAVVRITQGSLTENRLKTTGGVKGWFTVDQAERYDATIAARLDLYGADGRALGNARAEASRFQTIAEDATLNDRQRLWYALVEATVNDFAASMERAIREKLTPYVL
ncbi:hypothetical protein GCM10017083_43070 [Thalassobaculum fulvum]|uniref:Lipoprotein n=1 Tax=Thalassobaculum fulvum TaxID=1633335 RepID=A0A919CRF8_9PROT|nr:hypothetical protein [Thalassobaculum fulvum]GHD59217.1 hypothetical protein GCM10017083_43070 [Thalassobaculum fulvum]